MKTETNELEYQVEIRDLPEKSVAYVRHTGHSAVAEFMLKGPTQYGDAWSSLIGGRLCRERL